MVGEVEPQAPFEVLGTVGTGATGQVYRVLDRARGTTVALKTLELHDPCAVYRFKREFRAAAQLSHPNLVSAGGPRCLVIVSRDGAATDTAFLAELPAWTGDVRHVTLAPRRALRPA